MLCCASHPDRHLIWFSLITKPWLKTVAYTTIRVVLMKGLAGPWIHNDSMIWLLNSTDRDISDWRRGPGKDTHYDVTLWTCPFCEHDRPFRALTNKWSWGCLLIARERWRVQKAGLSNARQSPVFYNKDGLKDFTYKSNNSHLRILEPRAFTSI